MYQKISKKVTFIRTRLNSLTGDLTEEIIGLGKYCLQLLEFRKTKVETFANLRQLETQDNSPELVLVWTSIMMPFFSNLTDRFWFAVLLVLLVGKVFMFTLDWLKNSKGSLYCTATVVTFFFLVPVLSVSCFLRYVVIAFGSAKNWCNFISFCRVWSVILSGFFIFYRVCSFENGRTQAIVWCTFFEWCTFMKLFNWAISWSYEAVVKISWYFSCLSSVDLLLWLTT